LQNANTLKPTYVPGENETGTITLQLIIVGENACAEDTIIDDVQLQIDRDLVINAGDDITVFSNTSAKLAVNIEGGSGMYFYNWQPSMLVTDPYVGYTETRSLSDITNFEITVTDAKTGCIAIDDVTVFVEENPDAIINIFNAISPNGDGLNDNWIIDGIEKFPDNEVLIFNRWGDKVRELLNYNNESVVWHGTGRRDEKLPDGTYYYIVKLNEIKSYSGWVQIRSN
jgi:gliding motility-associated-like protein